MKQSGPTPVLVKAEVPWSAKRGALSDKDRVLKSVKGYRQQLILGFLAFVLGVSCDVFSD